MKKFIFSLITFLLLNTLAFAQTGIFKAGAFAQDISPEELPISINGNMKDGKANMVHDRIHARCIVLDDGITKLALVVCDSCMIPREVFDAAKKAVADKIGIPATNILCSATHTHSAPTATGVFQSEPEKDYPAFLSKKIAQGILEAHKRMVPAQIGWGAASDPTQVFNRRWFIKPGQMNTNPFGETTDKVIMNPGYQNGRVDKSAGPTDPEVSVLSLKTKEGKHIALLANYSLHYVGGFPAISADYFGAFAESIGVLLDADRFFVGIMSNGTSGDVNNANFAAMTPGKREPGEQIRVVANSVAKAAQKAVANIKYKNHVSLASEHKELMLGVRQPSKIELEKANEILTKANKTVLDTMTEIYARETVLLSKYPSQVPAIIQVMRIGDLGICAIPCEVFTEIGLELKKKSPLKQTFTISLANGYNGYLPTPEHHKLGGYETWRARSSYLETEASVKITSTLMGLLEKVRK
ncbi:MAG: hypothetical protein NTV50_03440 [Planctomycetota bacterium]|nr:hypothetical protein [Planctomycetota bacterium]